MWGRPWFCISDTFPGDTAVPSTHLAATRTLGLWFTTLPVPKGFQKSQRPGPLPQPSNRNLCGWQPNISIFLNSLVTPMCCYGLEPLMGNLGFTEEIILLKESTGNSEGSCCPIVLPGRWSRRRENQILVKTFQKTMWPQPLWCEKTNYNLTLGQHFSIGMGVILFQIVVHIMIFKIYFSVNKHKQYALTLGPLP